jgi:tRNA pseudouridine55 synthase
MKIPRASCVGRGNVVYYFLRQRETEGHTITGMLTIDKPGGMTSHTVVNRLRRIFDQKEVGHGGTLDPMATGVLPVFLGRGTKAASYVSDDDKTYAARIRLGITTDTQDITGTVLTQTDVLPGRDALEAVLPRFTGTLSQTPPMYSAVQVGGQRLYKLARAGVEIEREAREITISELAFTDVPEFGEPGTGEYDLRVTCSKGTFIRTLCADIGEALGCGATLAELRRLRTGIFNIADAYTLERLEEMKTAGTLAEAVRCCDLLFTELPRLNLTSGNALRIRRGAPVYLHHAPGRVRLYDPDGAFLGVGIIRKTDRRPELTIEKGMI